MKVEPLSDYIQIGLWLDVLSSPARYAKSLMKMLKLHIFLI